MASPAMPRATIKNKVDLDARDDEKTDDPSDILEEVITKQMVRVEAGKSLDEVDKAQGEVTVEKLYLSTQVAVRSWRTQG